MSIATDSIKQASRIGEIGFPEFTAKLITDVFNAIISANVSQQKAYIDLVKEISKGISQYVRENRNLVSGSDILNLLVRLAPDIQRQYGQSGTIITESNGNSFTQEEATKINNALIVEELYTSMNVANTTSLISELYKPILDAAAIRITADKYFLLQDMIKQGVLRLVINSGEISTSLNFEAKESRFYETQSEKYNRSEFDFSANVSAGTSLADIVNIATSTKYTTVGVSTVKMSSNLTTSTSVQIAGAVKLNFSTDYQPLNQLTDNKITTPSIVDATLPYMGIDNSLPY